MELTESIENINRQLVDQYGIDTITGQPIWRVVWSSDQREKRRVDTTDAGIFLLHPEVREVVKYPWIVNRWILERLVLIPEVNMPELPTQKLSYECMWKFEGKNQLPVPPTMWACKFIADTVIAAMGQTSLVKYLDEEAKNPVEHREKRLKGLEEELFGNETDVGDALAHREGVGYTKESK